MLVTCRRMLSIHSYLVILLLYLYITVFIGLYVCSCSCNNSLPQFSNVVRLHCVHAVQIRSRRVCEECFCSVQHFLCCCVYFLISLLLSSIPHHHTTTVLRPFCGDHPGEPLPEENFWTLWRKGRLTEADTPTIRLGATPSEPTSAHLHHPPYRPYKRKNI